MSGIRQSQIHTRQDALFLCINQAFELTHGQLCIFDGEQWFYGLQSFTFPLAIFPFGIPFAKEPGVFQHNPTQVTAGPMGINRAAKS